jgi:2-keto-4-pentenoate hydratase/2-oxohepta-3-ene-1,7-dioic acid hydratase in catechol pathway
VSRPRDRPADLVVTANGIGRLVDTSTIELVECPHPDLGALLRAEGSLSCLQNLPAVARCRWDTARLRPPMGATAQWGVGLNTHSKAHRTGRPAPDFPTLFVKPASATACPGAVVALPAHATAEFDFEGEIAVVVGAPLWRATPEGALASVAGYTAANDFTARDVMRRTGNPTLAKGFPGTAGLGPVLRVWPADPQPISLRTEVNGEVRQTGDSDDLMLGVGELLALLSTYVELAPGDVLLTGSPAGSGDEDHSHLRSGDIVSVQVDDLPPLVHRVLADDRSAS